MFRSIIENLLRLLAPLILPAPRRVLVPVPVARRPFRFVQR